MTRTKQVKGKKVQAKKLEYLSLNLFLRQPKKRLNAKQIIKKLKVKNSSDSVQVALDKLEKKGKIEHVKDKKYRLSRDFAFHENSEVETHDGYVDMTRSGAGYIVCEGLDQDIYVPARRLLKAMHGDKVRVQVRSRSGRKPEGEVIAILERATEKFIGNFQKSKNYGFVVPDNLQHPFDIYVYPENQGDAEDGNKVMVRVVDWPSRPGHNPVGVIEKVLDETDTHNVMMESILINHGFDMDFPSGVEKEANQLERVIRDDVISKRKDLRQVTTFTIDPSTAKDFDDALSLRYLENGHMEVGIHIADVSHYVQPGTALDKEALKRSTSVYLVDRVAPMLPEILSNELCSLRPDEDSLTFSALFEFDKDHNIVRRWFGKSVIHSDRRFAYEEAQEAINGAQSSYRKELLALNKLAKVLRARRMNEGSIAFESPEIQFELDENNHPIAIKTKERLDTHLLVEDFMLLANREVAQYISKKSEQEIPFVYRIHDKPDQEKLQEYSLFLKELGFNFDYQSPDNIRDSFNRLSKEAKKDEVLAFAEPFAVRTMAKAVYSTQNIGHFGLGFEYYTHFTSPIRRYADLLVHRLLEKNLGNTYRTKKMELEQKCLHISNQEKKAQEAERESIKFKQVEFIADHVGEVFTGIISGMIERGIFISLLSTQIEGMIGFASMSDSYTINDSRMKAVGNRTKHELKIGQKVEVKIVDVRIDDAEVDMVFAEDL